MPKHNTWIIKLGGSLIGSPALRHWLDAITVVGRAQRVVIVPGGGVFAEVVRGAQKMLGFDDAVAHDMAIQGMRQFGTALAALSARLIAPGLTPLAGIEAAECDNGIWIWDPCDPRLDGSALPRDWRVTSDSLSLWLCGELERSCLLLVKSRAPAGPAADVRGLAEEGFVDKYFPVLYSEIDRQVWWLEQAQSRLLAQLIDGSLPQSGYCRVTLRSSVGS
jgi:aspartokinase-like uncharacterized kinase